MGWLIALGILVLLAIIPLGVSAKYNEDGPEAKVIAGPFRILLYPRPPKKKEEKEKPKPQQKQEKTSGSAKQPKKGGKLSDFMPLIRLGLEFLGSLRRKIRVNHLDAEVILACDDPCDLAVNYGRAWAAIGNLMPRLQRALVIKKKDIRVIADFEGDQTRISARIDITITLGRLLQLAAVYGVKGLKEFLKLANKRKGGAKQ